MARKTKKTKHKFKGSWVWVFFWAILFWPVAIIYFFIKFERE